MLRLVVRGIGAVRNMFRHENDVLVPPLVETTAPPQAAPAEQPYSEARALVAKLGGNLGPDGQLLPNAFSVNLGVAPCNHTCLFCPQSVHKPKKARWLDLDVLRKVLGEMPEQGIQLGLSSYSETITAPNLVESVRLMKEIRPGLRIAMATNGTVFREQVISDLMEAGLDHLSFSFDAATPEDYAKMMQSDHFQQAWDSLEKIVEMRARKQSPMVITTHIMAFEGREAAFEKFKEYWDQKLDFVQWRRVANWGGDVWGLDKQMAAAGFVPAHKTPEQRYPCFSIFHHFKLNWDGYYYPCVVAVPDYEQQLQRHCVPPLGHASEITWQQAWENLQDMRQAHLEGRWDAYDACKSCDVWSMYDDVWEKTPAADGGTRFSIPGII